MAKNGLLFRLQRRLLLAAQQGRCAPRSNLPSASPAPSARAKRAASGHTHLSGSTDLHQSGTRRARSHPRVSSRSARPGRLAVISFHSLEDRMVKLTRRRPGRPPRMHACPCAKAKCPSPCCIPLAASRPRTMKWRSMPAPVPPCCAAERSATPLPAEGGAAFVHTGSCPAATSPFRARAEREGAADGPRQPDHCRVADAVGHFTGHQSVSVAPALRRAGQDQAQERDLEVGWRRLRWSAPSWRVTRAWMPLRAIASR